MDSSPLPGLVMISLILLSCAPWCSGRATPSSLQITPEDLVPPKNQNPQDSTADRIRLSEVEHHLHPGDIIFIDIPYYPVRQISDTTQCRSNHVGIAFQDEKNGWVVAESAVPLSRRTPLAHYLKRSTNGWCVIRRLRTGLNESQVMALKAQCDARMNIYYNTGFDFQASGQYCSKFVYEVYRDALGVNIGGIESFSQLLNRNPKANVGFWNFWFFGKIPWERQTITPDSQFNSKQLETAWQSGA